MRLDIQLFADGKVIIGTEINTSGVDDGIGEINKKILEFQERSEKRWAETFEQGFGSGVDKVEQIEEEVNQVNFNVQELSQQANKIEKKIGGIVKGIGKWALRLIGIRSAYAVISNAASQLDKTNKETKKDLDYMKMVVATAFEPVITKIVGWLKTMLSYVNAIYFRLTGKDLFKEAAKNMQSGAKSAKSIRKSLAGFDEMNVLSDTSGGGAGGGGGGSVSGFPKPEDVEIPSWMQWIVDNKQSVVDGLLGIAMGLTAVKLGLSALMGVGIGLIAFGLTELIRDMTNPETDGLEKAVKCFGDLLIIIGGITMLFSPLHGVIVSLIGLVIKFFPEISNWVSKLEDKIANWVEHVIVFVTEFAKVVKERFDEFKKNWEEGWKVITQWVTSLPQKILDAFISMIELLAEKLQSFANWVNDLLTRFQTSVNNALGKVKEWFASAKDWILQKWQSLKDSLVGFFTTTLPNTLKNAFNKVKDVISNVWSSIKGLFSKGGQIFDGIKDAIANVFKNIVNTLITGINKVIATPLNAINKMLNKIHDVDILGVKPFKSLWSRDPIKVPVIPKLAKGGVINMPGRGIAIGGESGKEGVIPLTDSQQMELLGEAIGRYITINANITNTMNGRVISRELQKIQQENNFAGNR